MSNVKIHISGGSIEKIVSPFPFSFIVIDDDQKQGAMEPDENEQDCEVETVEKHFVLSASSLKELILNAVNEAMGAAFSGSKNIEGKHPDLFVLSVINQIDL